MNQPKINDLKLKGILNNWAVNHFMCFLPSSQVDTESEILCMYYD